MVGQKVGPIYPWIEERHGETITGIKQVLTACESLHPADREEHRTMDAGMQPPVLT